jgi:hypothetical protein
LNRRRPRAKPREPAISKHAARRPGLRSHDRAATRAQTRRPDFHPEIAGPNPEKQFRSNYQQRALNSFACHPDRFRKHGTLEQARNGRQFAFCCRHSVADPSILKIDHKFNIRLPTSQFGRQTFASISKEMKF